jgi:hypothetical protein
MVMARAMAMAITRVMVMKMLLAGGSVTVPLIRLSRVSPILNTHVRFASVWMPKTEAKERDCLSSCWEK